MERNNNSMASWKKVWSFFWGFFFNLSEKYFSYKKIRKEKKQVIREKKIRRGIRRIIKW